MKLTRSQLLVLTHILHHEMKNSGGKIIREVTKQSNKNILKIMDETEELFNTIRKASAPPLTSDEKNILSYLEKGNKIYNDGTAYRFSTNNHCVDPRLIFKLKKYFRLIVSYHDKWETEIQISEYGREDLKNCINKKTMNIPEAKVIGP